MLIPLRSELCEVRPVRRGVEQGVALSRVGDPDAHEPALAVGIPVDRLPAPPTAFSFTASTSPESGAITSETAFTDSTSAYA
jgi:hypothetical protein